MAYASWSVVFGEQPSAAKWNILGTNDASFNDGTGIGTSVIGNTQLALGVLVQSVSTSTTAVSTGTTIIPADDTIPQNTEGDQVMSLAITPKSATNVLVIEANILCAHSAAVAHIAALFQDTTANALAAIEQYQGQTSGAVNLRLTHSMVAGTASATTMKIRLGGSSAGTMTFNGVSGGRRYGAITKSALVIYEYKAS